MSDIIKAAAERLRAYIERGGEWEIGKPEDDDENQDYRNRQIENDLWTLACDRIALGERQEDRWGVVTDNRKINAAFETREEALEVSQIVPLSWENARVVRFATFIREEGEGA